MCSPMARRGRSFVVIEEEGVVGCSPEVDAAAGIAVEVELHIAAAVEAVDSRHIVVEVGARHSCRTAVVEEVAHMAVDIAEAEDNHCCTAAAAGSQPDCGSSGLGNPTSWLVLSCLGRRCCIAVVGMSGV